MLKTAGSDFTSELVLYVGQDCSTLAVDVADLTAEARLKLINGLAPEVRPPLQTLHKVLRLKYEKNWTACSFGPLVRSP